MQRFRLDQVSKPSKREVSVHRMRVTIVALVWALLSPWLSAKAALTPTTASFFTAPADGTLTLTYEGYSADDTDHMVFTLDGDALFTNKTAAVGSAVSETVIAGQVYQLSLHDDHTGDSWSSNPASNWDGLDHLASTNAFSGFHLGATAPTPVNTNCAIAGGCYLGWEDRPGRGSDEDFNDLVFAVQFTPASPTSRSAGDPVPEPGSLTVLAVGLLGLRFTCRRTGRAAS